MGAAELWAAVVASYDEDGLVTLTNIRDRGTVSIDTAVGENAAQGVIDLWPMYAEVEYDQANPQHVEVAKRGTIAMLWQRGGTASAIAKVEWDEVFGQDGMVGRIRRTGARGRQAPVSNSGVQTKSELAEGGQPVRGWSDPDSLPNGTLPLRRIAGDS